MDSIFGQGLSARYQPLNFQGVVRNPTTTTITRPARLTISITSRHLGIGFYIKPTLRADTLDRSLCMHIPKSRVQVQNCHAKMVTMVLVLLDQHQLTLIVTKKTVTLISIVQY